MDEISVKGEKYIKASLIAKKFGYTADYVGQLCRSKQVKATLVGRSWYVNEDSLRSHKKSRYRSNFVKSKESVQELFQLQRTSLSPRFLSQVAQYDADEGDLIPVILKPKETESEKDQADPEEKRAINIHRSFEKKSEDKPNNKESLRLAEKVQKSNVNTKRPLVRVVHVSRSVEEITDAPKGLKQKIKAPSKGKSVLVGALLMIFSLVIVVGSSFAFVGLEKRVVMIGEDTSVVLYDLNFIPAKNMLNSYRSAVGF